jgi:hypothetical protein
VQLRLNLLLVRFIIFQLLEHRRLGAHLLYQLVAPYTLPGQRRPGLTPGAYTHPTFGLT